ncbi:MAG: Anion ABC transporter, anion-binding protein [Thermotoga sp. 50_1627]|uniref:substrate-binding domain-containing protein n=1 Tax=Pseudothermotoga sp. TaxID=2033661 RepID=UPI00076D375D|nr:MAG: Anion ABC transporter, anion-binding protein [Thermotoga sp. 50_64]KUK24738.1 MAG: Anion ABC transporter, anion-binding protein [Thermotoga sp. 50_1627]MBC7116499.1 substrate-binding domain-containing protein [Pseudothermotoga sp.]MDK2923108.1 tungstate transport system substrate-binding protein [Pseudothermotoga sp.]HBT40357.1 ABC transporter substrate-binding protein [Pseudothermotoga sp.]
MRNLLIFFLFLSVTLLSRQLIIATTTSLYETGLLDLLKTQFEKRYAVQVVLAPVGSGMALAMGRRGDADLLLVHSPADEEQFMKEGFGLERASLMYNDFVIVGPKEWQERRFEDVLSFMRYIYENQLLFVSRADGSGTHRKEQELWKNINVIPQGKWYYAAGTGMTQTLLIADELRAFCLTDRATFEMVKKRLSLKICYEDGELLRNVYSVILVNPKNGKRVNHEDAKKFFDFLFEDSTLELIENYSVNGVKLFRVFKR